MSFSVHIDNKGKDILIPGKGPTQGLREHSLSADEICLIKILRMFQIICAQEIFQKIFQQVTWKKLDLMVICMTLVLIMMQLIRIIL